MRIYTDAGDLAFKTFVFPDGQPHFKLETWDREFDEVAIEMAIKSPNDLFLALLANDTLRQHGYQSVRLNVRYLLGARMDRAIDTTQPFTLRVVARLLNGAGFTKIKILDAHSPAATMLIRNSVNILPSDFVAQVSGALNHDFAYLAPDKGAVDRVRALVGVEDFIRANKIRNPQTGEITNIGFDGASYLFDDQENVLILDDICDGGATFVALAAKLKEIGVKKVFLAVTHGIFSKGIPLRGIDKIFTTDSYNTQPPYSNALLVDKWMENNFTVIPVRSMKDMR
jgi:ribose-phosphate pyrophosphokinase